jgi:hypothetical protein
MRYRARATIIGSVITLCAALLTSFAYAASALEAQGVERSAMDKEKAPRHESPPLLAPITNARIIKCSGATVVPARLVLSWTYAAGERPDKVKIDVQRAKEGSVLVPSGTVVEVSGNTTTKAVSIGKFLDEPYTLILTAEYPPWGTTTYTFIRRCGE